MLEVAGGAVVVLARLDGGLPGTKDDWPGPVGLEVPLAGGMVVVGEEIPFSGGGGFSVVIEEDGGRLTAGGVSDDCGFAGGGAETTDSDGTGVFAEETGGFSAGGVVSTEVVPVKGGVTEATGDESRGVRPGASGEVAHTVTVTTVVTVLVISSKIPI